MRASLFLFATQIFLAPLAADILASEALVTLIRTPDGGIQPQAAVDAEGTLHLIYFRGDPGGGDLFYTRRPARQKEFSTALRVNGQRGSAMATGTIRGAHLAVGRNGRAHVVWDGMGSGAIRVSIGGKQAAPLLYTRLNDAGSAFEPERNVITSAAGLDGGSSVAADTHGNVYVAWHAPKPGAGEAETSRGLFVARSRDDGKLFTPEKKALAQQTGACACCGMRAFADTSGAKYILFRGASDELNRPLLCLVAPSADAEFTVAHSDNWRISTCPMSSATLTQVDGGALAAWETAGQVYFATVNAQTRTISERRGPPGTATRKHPVAVRNAAGETLMAWTEGTDWGKGGAVSWQVYGRDGKPGTERGRAEDLPAWSLPTAVATSNGKFSIVY